MFLSSNQYHGSAAGIDGVALHIFASNAATRHISNSLRHPQFQVDHIDTCATIFPPPPRLKASGWQRTMGKRGLTVNAVAISLRGGVGVWNTLFVQRDLSRANPSRVQGGAETGDFAAAYPTDNIKRPESRRNHSCRAATPWPCSCWRGNGSVAHVELIHH